MSHQPEPIPETIKWPDEGQRGDAVEKGWATCTCGDPLVYVRPGDWMHQASLDGYIDYPCPHDPDGLHFVGCGCDA